MVLSVWTSHILCVAFVLLFPLTLCRQAIPTGEANWISYKNYIVERYCFKFNNCFDPVFAWKEIWSLKKWVSFISNQNSARWNYFHLNIVSAVLNSHPFMLWLILLAEVNIMMEKEGRTWCVIHVVFDETHAIEDIWREEYRIAALSSISHLHSDWA